MLRSQTCLGMRICHSVASGLARPIIESAAGLDDVPRAMQHHCGMLTSLRCLWFAAAAAAVGSTTGLHR
jgi:hypothetical protein